MATKEEALAGAEARFVKAKEKAELAAAAMNEYTADAAASATKTARLKALRLAKEEADLAAAPVKASARKKKSAS